MTDAPRPPISDDPQQRDDIYVEPSNSTVQDWHGQVEQRQEELADAALAEAEGDEAEAERRFRAKGGEHPEDLPPG
jgi:hypothetical protein